MTRRTTLKGKTVMIAASYRGLADGIEVALENLGAKIVFSEYSPHSSKDIPLIIKEAKSHEPKIDAFILESDSVELTELQANAIELTKRLKKSCPVIMYRIFTDKEADIQPIRDAGAKYFDYLKSEDDQFAHAVVDAVAQHGKAGRRV